MHLTQHEKTLAKTLAIIVTVTVICAVAYGIYQTGEYRIIERQLHFATPEYSLGDTITLDADNDPAALCDWEKGSMEFTIESAEIFDGIDAARQTIHNEQAWRTWEYRPDDSTDDSVLVAVHFKVHNVDVDATSPENQYDTKTQMDHNWFNISFLTTDNRDPYVYFDGMPEDGVGEVEGNYFYLDVGETKEYTLIFSLKDTSEASISATKLAFWTDGMKQPGALVDLEL